MDADELIALAEEPQAAPQTAETSGTGEPTLRDRYRRTMFYQRLDRIPNFEFGYWDETLSDWHAQGLPPEVTDQAGAYAYFGIENWVNAPINMVGLCPAFPRETLELTEEYETLRDPQGVVLKINRHGHQSIPHYIDFPVKDRETWEAFKHRVQPSDERLPANWNELARAYNQRDYPLSVPMGSMIGVPRNWIGFEDIALMIYDDPELLEEIVETCCNMVCAMLERVLPDVEFDCASGWEDICFNSGPIVGVKFMREVVTPRYQRITNLLRKHGCHIAWTDCDGDVRPILDCFLDGGVNCLFPVEVHAGCDPVEIRKRWPGVRMQGGFCKMILPRGKKEIRAELERLKPIVAEGGFIPGVDHRVPADVPLENYKYYIKMKREILGVGGTPQYDESKIG